MVDIDDVLDWIERLGNILGQVISTVFIILLLGDLLGINIGQLIVTVITKPWVIPVEWIYQYYWLWYGMMWTLFLVIVGDQVYTMRYTQKYKKLPPPSYVRWISLTEFLLSFWLALVLRYASLTMICIFSAISFAYTMFVRRE